MQDQEQLLRRIKTRYSKSIWDGEISKKQENRFNFAKCIWYALEFNVDTQREYKPEDLIADRLFHEWYYDLGEYRLVWAIGLSTGITLSGMVWGKWVARRKSVHSLVDIGEAIEEFERMNKLERLFAWLTSGFGHDPNAIHSSY